jgi:hypothetical protein
MSKNKEAENTQNCNAFMGNMTEHDHQWIWDTLFSNPSILSSNMHNMYIYILKDMGIYGQLLNIALSLAIAAIYRFFVRDLSLLHLLGMQCANAGSWMLGGMKKTPET